jgi:hypothetical protein
VIIVCGECHQQTHLRCRAFAHPEGERCAFHAKSLLDPDVPRYYHYLKETVEMWNKYGPLAEKESIRQFLSASNQAANLRKRDANSGAIIVGEVPKDDEKTLDGDVKAPDGDYEAPNGDHKTRWRRW